MQPAEDHPVFEEFRRLHRERLYRAVTSVTREPDAAAEAVDWAMTQAAQSWDNVDDLTKPAGLVYRIALRRAKWAGGRRSIAPPGTLPDPDVNAALARLPFRLRAVVVARFYLDWTPEEIATALRLSSRTVERRLRRALRLIGRTVGEQ